MLTLSQTGWSIPPPSMRPGPSFVEALASAFIAGELTFEGVLERGTRALGRRWRWLPPLARRYVKAFSGRTRPRRQTAVQFILSDRAFRRFWQKHSSRLRAEHWLIEPQQMQPATVAAKWELPAIESVGALAEWLGVDIGYLQWFADLRGFGYKNRSPKLRHHHYRILAKDSGQHPAD